MKNIILIEDRINRQELFINRIGNNILSSANLMNIAGGKDFVEYAHKISEKDLSVFDGYDAIIVHRSAFEQTERQVLISYCSDFKKPLTFFSGGISASVYSETLGFPFLSCNSNALYSSNFKPFLDKALEGEINLLLLAFGQNWELNNLLNYELHLTSLIHDKEFNSKIPSVVMKEKLKLSQSLLELLEGVGYSFDWLENSIINDPRTNIEQLHKSLSLSISNKIAFS